MDQVSKGLIRFQEQDHASINVASESLPFFVGQEKVEGRGNSKSLSGTDKSCFELEPKRAAP